MASWDERVDAVEREREVYVEKSALNSMKPFLLEYIRFLDREEPDLHNCARWRRSLMETGRIEAFKNASQDKWYNKDLVRKAKELIITRIGRSVSRKRKRKRGTKRTKNSN